MTLERLRGGRAEGRPPHVSMLTIGSMVRVPIGELTGKSTKLPTGGLTAHRRRMFPRRFVCRQFHRGWSRVLCRRLRTSMGETVGVIGRFA
jgi:hypothetical protein